MVAPPDNEGNGIPEICEGSSPCAADVTGPQGDAGGNMDCLDLLLLIGPWGSPGNCPAR